MVFTERISSLEHDGKREFLQLEKTMVAGSPESGRCPEGSKAQKEWLCDSHRDAGP